MPSSLGFIIDVEAVLTSILIFLIYLIFLATTPNMKLLSPQLNNTPLLWLDSKQVEKNPMPDTEPKCVTHMILVYSSQQHDNDCSISKRRKLKLGQVNTIIQDCSDGAGLRQLHLWGINLTIMLYDYTEIPTRIKLVEPKNESVCNCPPRVRHCKIIDGIIKADTIRKKQ